MVHLLFVNLVFAGLCAADSQVNVRTTYDQRDVDVATDSHGRCIAVWTSYLQDGSSNGIFGRHLDPNRSPIGEEFQINETSSGNQTEPAVALTAAGFVATWHGPAASDDDSEDILARHFDSNGMPLGAEFPVNTNAVGRQICPDVAAGRNGSFIVVWESFDVPGPGDRAICGRLYDGKDVAAGPEFVINAVASVCRYPSVAADANGCFAVAWLDDRSTNSIMCRLFDPNGVPATDEFQVNTDAFRSVTRPSIAMDPAGYFVAAWDGHPDLASLDDVHARVFEPNGAPLGEQFLVNATADGPQTNPHVALNEVGEFVIVWETETGPNANERDIFAQRFRNFGEPLGSEFQVNVFTEGDQRYPVAALGGDGQFVTAWQSYQQDGSRYGIFAANGRMVGSADLNGDGFVDLHDYRIFGEQWLEAGPALPADLVYDDIIDVQDLAEFCRQWLMLAD